MAKKGFVEREKLFTDKMNLELKKRVMKCIAWKVALYAAETWTLAQKIGSFCNRNYEYGEEWKRAAGLMKLLMRNCSKEGTKQILNSIWQRKHRWIGNILRHDGLFHEIIKSRTKAKPTRGRRRIQMLR